MERTKVVQVLTDMKERSGPLPQQYRTHEHIRTRKRCCMDHIVPR